MLLNIIIFIIVLGVLILFHEFGHFIAAKRAGVRVLEFGFGFPPRIFGKKVGDTIYSINAIPLGGFVQLYGEGGDHKTESDSYIHKSIGSRFWIMVMGVVMNFVLAWILLSICFGLGMSPISGDASKYKGATVDSKVIVTDVVKGSPAENAGLKPGAQIEKIDNQIILSADDLQNYTKTRPNQQTLVTYKQDSQQLSKEIKLSDKNNQGVLGVMIYNDQKVTFPWWQAPFVALVETGKLIWTVLKAFVLIIVNLVAKQQVPADSAGPVGIFKYTSQAVSLGIVVLLQFVALLSINLGILNIFPFPALDGGKLLFLGIEKIRKGKKVKPQVENTVHLIGFAILIALVILITIRDIKRFY